MNEILEDVILIFKLILANLYFTLETLVRNLFIPNSIQYKSIKGEIALITGSARGIGAIMAKKLLRLGCTIVCIDINEKELKQLEEELTNEFSDELSKEESPKKRMHFYVCDLSSIDQIKSMASKVKKEVGKVDILINNAGVMSRSKLLMELTEEDIMKTFKINALAHFWTVREFLPDMMKENKGHILNVASVCGFAGSYKLTDYCSSKFAAVGFAESLRIELKSLNPENKIVISIACPFHIKTKLFNGVEFKRFKWSGFSMEPEAVAKEIVEGLLLNKELIFIPKGPVAFLYGLKNISTTKYGDFSSLNFRFHESMDSYKFVE